MFVLKQASLLKLSLYMIGLGIDAIYDFTSVHRVLADQGCTLDDMPYLM
jgi:hypothetical protein